MPRDSDSRVNIALNLMSLLLYLIKNEMFKFGGTYYYVYIDGV
jgi:hypothetical protein